MRMNKIIIRNANLSSNCENFTKDFADIIVSSLLDFYADYNKMKLNEESRDMTTFQTFLKLLKMTTILMKVMNSVRQFVWATQQILVKHISHDAVIYLNDMRVKDLKIKYNNKKMSSEVKKYILKHLQCLNWVLTSIELFDAKLNEEKSQFCQSEIIIVEYACNYDERHSEIVKVIKIMNWFFCLNIMKTRTFINVCMYY